jgi:hypothetical protein
MNTTYLKVSKRHLREFLLSVFGTDKGGKTPTIEFPRRHEVNLILLKNISKIPSDYHTPEKDFETLQIILPKTRHLKDPHWCYLSEPVQQELNAYLFDLVFLPVFLEYMRNKRQNGRNHNSRIYRFMHLYRIDPACFDALKKYDYRQRELQRQFMTDRVKQLKLAI